jgi:Nif-specific regulatory protein
MSEGHWVLRDLESRNGTVVGEQLLTGDWVLKPGDLIRIGHSQLVFVHNLSEAFGDSGSRLRRADAAPGATGKETEAPEGSAEDVAADDSSILSAYEPTTITHRKGQTRFLESTEEGEGSISKIGRAAAKLCRLAFELGKATDAGSMAEMALSGLFETLPIDAGALLLLPRDFQGSPTGNELEVVASRTAGEARYHRVTNFLAATVMREGEAVLARNVAGDSSIGSRDSKGEIHATSVLCAPIRRGRKVLGLLHLYSTNVDKVPEPDDLEFTLAVGDTVAVALTNLNRRQELAENLRQPGRSPRRSPARPPARPRS